MKNVCVLLFSSSLTSALVQAPRRLGMRDYKRWARAEEEEVGKEMVVEVKKLPRSTSRYVDSLSKFELFKRLQSEKRQSHDDVVIRSSFDGTRYAIPQAERYKGRDWGSILVATPASGVLRRIRHPLSFMVVWALCVATVKWLFGFPSGQSAGQIHGLLGNALGLLLVFRTNAAYQRFWEGRTVWEDLLGVSRSLARMCMLYRKELGRERVKRLANLICAFSFVFSEHLGAVVQENYSHLLSREDLLLLNRVGNRPLSLINTMASEIRTIPDKNEDGTITFSSRERLTMLGHLEKMTKVNLHAKRCPS